MAQVPDVDKYIMQLKQIIEEKNVAILQLRSRIDGNCTMLRFLLERMNNNIIESRLSYVNNNGYDAYEIKLDKLVREIDVLEQNLNQHFRSS